VTRWPRHQVPFSLPSVTDRTAAVEVF
jgi:hypothetical protein